MADSTFIREKSTVLITSGRTEITVCYSRPGSVLDGAGVPTVAVVLKPRGPLWTHTRERNKEKRLLIFPAAWKTKDALRGLQTPEEERSKVTRVVDCAKSEMK